MNTAKGNDDAPVWNMAELLHRVDNDQELLRDLLGIFKDDFPTTMQALQKAVSRGDLKNASSLSHTLKGMFSNLGATRSAAAAARLESLTSSGQQSAVNEALTTLERETGALAPQIEAYLGEVRT